ncbi:MAG: repeat containing protein [Cyanobacteria bacterium RYN_339]|nr:repeat containing protein [Cyanobacteria bacterium RYN_339]
MTKLPRRALTCLVLALAACTRPPVVPTGHSPSPSPSPTPTPPSVTVPSPTASPSATSTLAPTPAPTSTATPVPAATATPIPLPSLPPQALALRKALEDKLTAIAKLSFTTVRSSLATGPGILSDAAAGIIGNHGGGLIGQNGAGVIGNNGGGYRLAQVADDLQTTPQAGEVLLLRHLWPDGTSSLGFARPGVPQPVYHRLVELDAAGKVREMNKIVTVDGPPKVLKTVHLGYFPDGGLNFEYHVSSTRDANGNPLRFSFDPGTCKFRDPSVGAEVNQDQLEVDAVAHTGTFRYSYPKLGLVESGSFTRVDLTEDGRFVVADDDPLGYYDGQSRVETTAGALVFTKTQAKTSGKTNRTYDLQGGLSLALTKTAERKYEGGVLQDGKEVGKVAMETSVNGTVLFTLTFNDEPGVPYTLGFGLSAPTGAPPPPVIPIGHTATLAGVPAAGYADGPGATARFDRPGPIVQSRVNPAKFYIGDINNHRLRVMTVALDGTATVSTLAGSGVAGVLDGKGTQAQFFGAYGLAVAADDTLYMADGPALRKITPDGTVSTVAGGTRGFADGPVASAKFDIAVGMALGPDGTLYIADYGAQRIRTLAAGVVSTLAGDGTAGFLDGPAGSARFNGPAAVELGANGAVYVADRDNFRVRRIANGVVSTYGGSGRAEDALLDARPATAAGLNPPHALARRSDDTLFVGSIDVRYVTPGGAAFNSYASGSATGVGGFYRDGLAHDALFDSVNGLAFGPEGWLFVTDTNMVRVIYPGVGAP